MAHVKSADLAQRYAALAGKLVRVTASRYQALDRHDESRVIEGRVVAVARRENGGGRPVYDLVIHPDLPGMITRTINVRSIVTCTELQVCTTQGHQHRPAAALLAFHGGGPVDLDSPRCRECATCRIRGCDALGQVTPEGALEPYCGHHAQQFPAGEAPVGPEIVEIGSDRHRELLNGGDRVEYDTGSAASNETTREERHA